MGEHRELAGWLVRQRRGIEVALGARLGAAMPAPSSPEAEALRRFRSFAAAALRQGERAQPALEGLRVSERRTGQLLAAWVDAAAGVAGADGPGVQAALAPLLERFRRALRGTGAARRASGAPRASPRRAVSAAIDRIADAFLAVDADSGTIEDANPAAGALLGTTRDALLGADVLRFVPEGARELWWTQLDAMAEGCEPRRFRAALIDTEGHRVLVEATVTRFATRKWTLALLLARPASRDAGSERAPGGSRRPEPLPGETSPAGSHS